MHYVQNHLVHIYKYNTFYSYINHKTLTNRSVLWLWRMRSHLRSYHQLYCEYIQYINTLALLRTHIYIYTIVKPGTQKRTHIHAVQTLLPEEYILVNSRSRTDHRTTWEACPLQFLFWLRRASYFSLNLLCSSTICRERRLIPWDRVIKFRGYRVRRNCEKNCEIV